MKRTQLVLLILVFLLGITSLVWAQPVNITIGTGTGTNTTTSTPTPYGTFYKSFRQQYLFTAMELAQAGGGAGPINSIAFNVQALNTCSPMPNFRIRIKNTTLTALTTTFEAGTYTQVWQQAEFTPVVGWNTHTFTTPFAWDGTSNIIVDIVSSLIPGAYTQNASVFFTPTTGVNTCLRFQSDTVEADTGTTGSVSVNRANTVFNMAPYIPTNPPNPAVLVGPPDGGQYIAVLPVLSWLQGGGAPTGYKVFLGTNTPPTNVVNGFDVGNNTTYTPTNQLQNNTQYYWKIVPYNNYGDATNCPIWSFTTVTSGLAIANIGSGVAMNGIYEAPTPYGTYYKAFRQQYLYLASEILSNGGAPGLISGIGFNVQALNTCVAMPNFTIRMKNTTLTALTTTFEVGEYTTVWTNASFLPVVGWNIHTLGTPYFWDGVSNVIVEIVTDMIPVAYTQNASVFYTPTTGVNTSLRFQSDTVNGSTGTTGSNSVNRANTRIIVQVGGMGALNGTVTTGGNPLAGATVSIVGTSHTATTSATGTYSFPFITQGAYQVTCSKTGFQPQTVNVTIVENQTVTQNFAMVSLPLVNVTGMVAGSDAPTVGIPGATITLTGMANYTATTNAQGQFTITGVYASQTYSYTVVATGYSPATGTVNVGATNHNMGTVIVNEITFPATGVQATEVLPNVNLTWTAPNPNVQNLTESFENATFPPQNWAQTITDTGPANTYGVTPTWCRVGSVALTPPVAPPDGQWQAGLWWSYNHQDEWLKTPQFTCPPNASLVFKSYVYLGSTYNDHYYVKVSTNNGSTWTMLWDASTQPGAAWNAYATNPITIPLASYGGQQIRLAWHALDPPSNDGLWYVWFMDQIFVGSPTQTVTFNLEDMEVQSAGPQAFKVGRNLFNGYELPAKGMALGIEQAAPVISSTLRNDRALTGYKVWRLLEGQETNEAAWTLLTPTIIPVPTTAYSDTGWGAVPDGTYKWAVKAVYTGDVLTAAALSNAITKQTQIGTIAGIVRKPDNTPIVGATVTAGTATATSNVTGAYSMQVPAGFYTVTCAAIGYVTGTQTGIVVLNGETTTVNFVLAVSNLVTDGFESYDNFVIDFAPWVNVDVDQSTTYTITGVTFLHSGEAMAYIVFNPSATTPPLTTAAWTPHGGAKFAGCFAGTTPPNNDWLISQLFNNIGTEAEVSFWAKSVTANYGLERFKVGVSTGGTAPANFTFISGATYIQAPIDWTQYTFDIPATYVGQNIRVGIQCVSDDAFVFMVDDFVMNLGTVSNVDPVTPVVATALKANFPNPFSAATTINYSVKGRQPVVVDIYNTKGQKVKTLVNETKAEGNHSITWDGKDDNNVRVSNGVYFYKMNAGKYTSSRKMIMLK